MKQPDLLNPGPLSPVGKVEEITQTMKKHLTGWLWNLLHLNPVLDDLEELIRTIEADLRNEFASVQDLRAVEITCEDLQRQISDLESAIS